MKGQRAQLPPAIGDQVAANVAALNLPCRLQEQRRRLGLTQKALAQRLGLTQQRVAANETAGRVNMQLETIVALAHGLGLRVRVEFEDLPVARS